MSNILCFVFMITSVLATNIDHIDEAPRAAPLAAPAVDAITPLRDVEVPHNDLRQAIRELSSGTVGSFTFGVGKSDDCIGGTFISPAFLGALKGAKALTTLHLRLVQVTEPSFLDLIKALRHLPKLRTLRLGGLDPRAVHKFREH